MIMLFSGIWHSTKSKWAAQIFASVFINNVNRIVIWTSHYWYRTFSPFTTLEWWPIYLSFNFNTNHWWEIAISPKPGISSATVFRWTAIKQHVSCWTCKSKPRSAQIGHILSIAVISTLLLDIGAFVGTSPVFCKVYSQLAFYWW